MKVFYDTEFVERGPDHPIHFVSIGMVAEDGRELYAVNADMEQELVRTHPWVDENVWPHLPLTGPAGGTRDASRERLDTDHPDVRPRAAIARLVAGFLDATPDVELWAWYGSYDHVVLAQLFGSMVRFPERAARWTNDLRQEAARLGDPRLPEQSGGEHHALADARHNLVRARALGLLDPDQPLRA
ncbi:3'-5' exoribonuclease [Nocardiopsis sp. NPDC006139]|uniref:3'-5' exoribonuclease domain-containing protein n=1 Tax=unclassified Nocardiopsis TaxID=2649073 RepID=UPI00159A44F5|nr:3'-5' exoribonuclease [Nocardiopsis flavescens]